MATVKQTNKKTATKAKAKKKENFLALMELLIFIQQLTIQLLLLQTNKEMQFHDHQVE